MYRSDDPHHTDQVIDDINVMNGYARAGRGTFGADDHPDALSDKMQRIILMHHMGRIRWYLSWWLRWPQPPLLLLGYLAVVTVVATGRLGWQWAVLFQCGTWMLTLARDSKR